MTHETSPKIDLGCDPEAAADASRHADAEILAEHLKLSKAEAARRLRISRPSLYAILNGDSAVTAEMARRFSRLAGGEPSLYLNMQAGYDLWHAQQRLAATLKEINPAPKAAGGRNRP